MSRLPDPDILKNFTVPDAQKRDLELQQKKGLIADQQAQMEQRKALAQELTQKNMEARAKYNSKQNLRTLLQVEPTAPVEKMLQVAGPDDVQDVINVRAVGAAQRAEKIKNRQSVTQELIQAYADDPDKSKWPQYERDIGQRAVQEGRMTPDELTDMLSRPPNSLDELQALKIQGDRAAAQAKAESDQHFKDAETAQKWAQAKKDEAEADKTRNLIANPERTFQEKSGSIDGKPTVAMFEPKTGKHFVGGVAPQNEVQTGSGPGLFEPKELKPSNEELEYQDWQKRRNSGNASLQKYANDRSGFAEWKQRFQQQNFNIKLADQPTQDDAPSLAADIVNKRIAPSQLSQIVSSRGAAGQKLKLDVYREAKKLDPNFQWEEAESTYKLAAGPAFQNTVRYMDSVVESIPRLQQSALKLGNGKFRTWNEILNAGKNQFNDADLKAFKTDAVLVGDEVAKIIQGGGGGGGTSDAKLKQATDIISQSDSVPAIASALNEIQFLIGNRRQSLTRGTYMEGRSAGGADKGAAGGGGGGGMSGKSDDELKRILFGK